MGDIIALIQTATTDEYAILSIQECPENKLQIDSPGTHDADQPDFTCILQSGNSSQVSSSICSPMAHKTENLWCKLKPVAHYKLASHFFLRCIDLAQNFFIGKVF